MGTSRDAVDELLDGLIDFGSIEATTLGDSDGVEATIRGADDGESPEERAGCEVWGLACVQYRPAAGTEVLLLRRGDEIVGLCTKDRRLAVTLESGEAVVTNLSSDTPARVRLLASGEVLIEASKVGVVAPDGSITDATEALARASACESKLGDLNDAIAAWTPAPNDGGAALKTQLTTKGIGGGPGTWPGSLGSARVFSED